MPDDLSPWEALDAAVAAEAEKQGLERPEWVARLLQGRLDPTATQAAITAEIRSFRRENPWFLQVSDGGLPVTLEGDAHGVQRPERERRADGTYAPREPEPPASNSMNEAMLAMWGGDDEEEADPRLARLAASLEPPAAGAAPPTNEAMNDALRRLSRGADNPADALRRARGDDL